MKKLMVYKMYLLTDLIPSVFPIILKLLVIMSIILFFIGIFGVIK